MTGQRVTYLDSSAIVKLVRTEPESAALSAYLRRRSPLLSSALAHTEVVRALLSIGEEAVERAELVLQRIELVRVSDRVLQRAARLRPVNVCSLDAIHLATAELLGGSLARLVTYDGRMAAAAREAGLSVAAPT